MSRKKSVEQTDCAFVIDGKEIKAHKLMLTENSPVFEKMFFGKFASDRVTITDISYEDFSQMLDFVYTENVRIESVFHAWSLFYVSHKYLMNDLTEVCTSYIKKNLSLNNLVLSYEFAEMYAHEELKTFCMNDISSFIRGVFEEYHMKPSTIVTILEQPNLNISSSELVKHVMQWAVIECDINGIELNPETVMNFLESTKILNHLTDLEFGIDTTSEELIQTCLELIKNSKPDSLPSRKYPQKPWCTFCKCRQYYKIAGRLSVLEQNILLADVTVSRNVILYGLVLVAAEDEGKSESLTHVRIRISLVGRTDTILEMNFAESEPSCESLIYVPLSDLLFLRCDVVYNIKIQYIPNHELGFMKSTIVCNYMNSQLVDKEKNIVFNFFECYGGVIRGLCYYPV